MAVGNRRSAISLIEVTVCIAIIAVIATSVLLGWGRVRNAAEEAKCLSNLRSLQTSFASYVQDNGHWPQEPGVAANDYTVDTDWWIKEMTPYGGGAEVWLCPTITRLQKNEPPAERWKMHYVPSIFGPLAMDPYRYSTQPWLIEAAGPHGHGPLICFPDGSIKALDDLTPKK